MSDAESRAARWLAAWDGQGVHRTGTVGDAAGAAWLAEAAATLGAEPTIEEFALERLDPVACHLDIEGRRIDGVPVFDAPPSGPAGVVGRLCPIGGTGEIAVAELTPRAVYSGEFRELRRTGAYRGFVAVCRGEQPGLGLLNAEQFREPYGAPALHVSSEARDTVLAAAAQGAPARLVADSVRTRAQAANVVVNVDGRDPGRRKLVVMTPRSSWWQSTAERGGGIVCWLESLRAALAARPAGDVVFAATSGHELGHLGLDDFIARRPGWDRSADAGGVAWVHYGANIGAAGGALALVSANDELRALGAAALTEAGQPPDQIAPKTLVPSGETRDIHRAGGDYLTLVGTNPLFHLPQDRWPEAVDLAAVTRIAAAASCIIRALTA